MEELFDLHTHSAKSDGKLSPAELVRAAKATGIAVLALTDHDNIDGLPEAGKAADECGIRLINGVEIEINWNESGGGGEDPRREFHLLGLGIDSPSEDFRNLMRELLKARSGRNSLIVRRMEELSLPADLDEIYRLSGNSFLGRPHFAEYLVRKGAVGSFGEAFKKYLAKGQALYVPKKGAEFERALAAIKDSGGIAVLAHPKTLYVSSGHTVSILKKLKALGLDGIEAWHPLCTVKESRRYCAMAADLGLCVSAGSDYHGEGRRERSLGRSSGGIKITRDLFRGRPPECARN